MECQVLLHYWRNNEQGKATSLQEPMFFQGNVLEQCLPKATQALVSTTCEPVHLHTRRALRLHLVVDLATIKLGGRSGLFRWGHKGGIEARRSEEETLTEKAVRHEKQEDILLWFLIMDGWHRHSMFEEEPLSLAYRNAASDALPLSLESTLGLLTCSCHFLQRH